MTSRCVAPLLALWVVMAPAGAYSQGGYPPLWQGGAREAAEAHICSWAYIDACTEEMRDWMARSLITDTTKLYPALKQNVLAMLAPSGGEHLLDVGCGTGDDARAFAEAIGPQGTVTAVDPSAAMLSLARRRAMSDLSGAPIAFHQASAYNLSGIHGFGRFDVAHVQRTLQHLQRPLDALREMAAAVRCVGAAARPSHSNQPASRVPLVASPGGRVFAVEVDWGSIVVAHPDRSTTQHILTALQGLVAQPWAGRQLRQWMRRIGLKHVRVRPVAVATASLDVARFDEQVRTISADGFLDTDVVQQWLSELRQEAAQGDFFYAITAFIAVEAVDYDDGGGGGGGGDDDRGGGLSARAEPVDDDEEEAESMSEGADGGWSAGARSVHAEPHDDDRMMGTAATLAVRAEPVD